MKADFLMMRPGTAWRIKLVGMALVVALAPSTAFAQPSRREPPASARAASARSESPKQNKAAVDPVSGSARVAGVTITASRIPPHVVGTFPADHGVVAPGVLVLRVTFDQPMFDESWSYVTSADGDYPDCAPTPRLLDDRKSFALICRVTGKRTYALWLNRGAYDNFMNRGHRRAVPYELKFSTSDADPIFTLKEAMAADPGLPPGSNPAEPTGKAKPGEVVDDPDAP